jgi:hypothetical protein
MSNFPFPGLMELQTPVSDGLSRKTKLNNHKKSDSLWEGVSLGPYRDGLEYMPEAAVSARMVFSRKSDGALAVLSLTTDTKPGGNEVSIVGNQDNWLFLVSPQKLSLDAGMWFWTFVVTDQIGNDTQTASGTLLITT